MNPEIANLQSALEWFARFAAGCLAVHFGKAVSFEADPLGYCDDSSWLARLIQRRSPTAEELAVLMLAGSSLDRIVQVHAMIYDRIEYDVLNRVYRQYVPHAPPARTVMSVQIEAGFKVMLDVTAAA